MDILLREEARKLFDFEELSESVADYWQTFEVRGSSSAAASCNRPCWAFLLHMGLRCRRSSFDSTREYCQLVGN